MDNMKYNGYHGQIGSDLQNIIDCIWMAKDITINGGDKSEAARWLDMAKVSAESISRKVWAWDEENYSEKE